MKKLNFDRVVSSKLNPLKVCSGSLPVTERSYSVEFPFFLENLYV